MSNEGLVINGDRATITSFLENNLEDWLEDMNQIRYSLVSNADIEDVDIWNRRWLTLFIEYVRNEHKPGWQQYYEEVLLWTFKKGFKLEDMVQSSAVVHLHLTVYLLGKVPEKYRMAVLEFLSGFSGRILREKIRAYKEVNGIED